MNKTIFLLLTFSLLFSHFSTEECFQLEDCPKCEECKECKPCPELEECYCETCPECPEICEGECYTDEEAQNIELYIQELEQKDSLNVKIQESLDKEIYMYIQQDSTYQSLIKDMEHTIELRDKLIKEVTPKWWENKWIWFGLGVVGVGTLNSLVD